MSLDNQGQVQKVNEQKEVTLTEGNWQFLKHLRLGATIPEAYRLAGYAGNDPSAGYVLYSKIKKKLEEVVKADGFDKLRLSLDFQKVLSLPLADDKKEVTLTEWLKIRRLAHTIMTDNEQKSPQSSFTMIVIETGGKGDNGPTSVQTKQTEIIDIEPVSEDVEQKGHDDKVI